VETCDGGEVNGKDLSFATYGPLGIGQVDLVKAEDVGQLDKDLLNQSANNATNEGDFIAQDVADHRNGNDVHDTEEQELQHLLCTRVRAQKTYIRQNTTLSPYRCFRPLSRQQSKMTLSKDTTVRNRQIGVALMLFGSVLFSCKAIVIKLAYQYEVSSISLLGLRMAFALPFFLLIGFFRRERSSTHGPLSGKDFFVIVTIGILGYYLASYTDFLGLQYLSAGMERLILFAYPTIVLILQRLIFKTPIKPVQWLATAVCYLGIGLAFSGSDFSIGNKFTLGAALVFSSAMTYSFFVVGSGHFARKLGSVRFTSLALIAASIAVLAHVFISGNTLFGFPPGLYAYGLTLAIFCTVIPTYLVTEGIRRIGAGDAAILGATGPVATIILEYLILNEHLNLVQGLGAALVIVGVVIIGRSK
jgi:drug/metabolite transporter (DMT)-like permease